MGGWDMVRARLKGDGITPMIFFMENCVHAIRTLPLMEHDERNLEDINTDSEDHAPDEIRYACMSRPYSNTAPIDTIRKILRQKDNTIALHDMIEEFKSPKNYNRARIE